MIGRMVIFGATGDLTARLLLPAVAELVEGGALPADLEIVGSAMEEWTPATFRAHMAEALAVHASHVAPAARQAVAEMLDYRPSDVTDPASVRKVVADAPGRTLVYLALPSSLLEAALTALTETGLSEEDAVAIEKPFGADLTSAQRLNRLLRTHLPEPTIFRIDHFLSDELVRRIVALRFANRIFEPVLNTHHVARVDISWLESLTLEGRAGYYDRAGALKDMIQNHLIEVLSLVVMEQPARLDAASFRSNRVEALRAVTTPTPTQIRAQTVRARYGAGRIGARSVPAYVNEPGVDPDRGTETYAAVQLAVRNTRWSGVPFLLRSGKALPANAGEIAIHFRSLPPYLFDGGASLEANVLRIGLMEPYVRLDTMVNGSDDRLASHELEMRTPAPGRSAYANLILEMCRNRPMLFIRSDEAEEAWRIIDPIARAWAADQTPMLAYPAGQAPPSMPG